MLEIIVTEPFLVLLLCTTFINIVLIGKVIVMKKRPILFRNTSTHSNDPTISIPKNLHYKIEPVLKQLPQEEKKILTHSVSFNSDNINRGINNRNQIQGCNYCQNFYNVGTAICPNCGELLNLKIHA